MWCPAVEVRDKAGEVNGESQEFEYPDEMLVVWGGERSFKI